MKTNPNKDLKEIIYSSLIFFMVLIAYFCLWAFINYAVESSRKSQPQSPTYGIINTNELA